MEMTETIVNKGQLKYIPLENLHPSELNTYDPADIQDFAEEIKSVGIIHPLCVCDTDKDGNYEILAGERRYRAAAYLCETNPDEYSSRFGALPAMVVDNDTVGSKNLKSIVIEMSNVSQRDFDKAAHRMRLAKLVHSAMDDKEISHQEAVKTLQRYMGTSQRYCNMYLAIEERANDDIKQMFQSGELYTHVASNAANLSPDRQDEFVDRVKGGEKPKDVLSSIYSSQRRANTGNADFPIPSVPEDDAFRVTPSDSDLNKLLDSIETPNNVVESENGERTYTHGPNYKTQHQAQKNEEEPQFTDDELFAINNPEYDDEDGLDDDSLFSYTPGSNRGAQAIGIDTTGRFGIVNKVRDVHDEADVEKLQSSVKRNLEAIRRQTVALTDSDVEFLNYVDDWVTQMRSLV